MPISTPLDPNQLRKDAAAKLASVESIQDQLDDTSLSLTAEQRRKLEDKQDSLLEDAKTEKKEADDIEEREYQAQSRGRAKPRNPGDEELFGPLPASMVVNDTTGDSVPLLSHGQSFAEASGYRGGTRSASLGEIAHAVAGGSADYSPAVQAALSGGSDPYGGYFLPVGTSDEVIDLARSESVMSRAGMRVFDMNNAEESILRVTGDPTVTWTGENRPISQTTPTFGRLRFRARKVTAIAAISSELLEDAGNSMVTIENLLVTAISQEIDRAALLGSGDGEEPTGIFNYEGVTENAIGGAVDWDDFLDSRGTIETVNGSPTGIIYPPLVKKSLAKLKVNSEANHYASPPADLSGLGRFTTTKLATSQSVIGDFSQVLMGVRRGVNLAATTQGRLASGEGFETDSVLLKITMRCDIQIARPQFIEKLTGIS